MLIKVTILHQKETYFRFTAIIRDIFETVWIKFFVNNDE